MNRIAPALTLAACLSATGCAALASLFTATAPQIGQGLAAYEQAVEAARQAGPLPPLPASDPAVLAAQCAARTVAAVQADVERAKPPTVDAGPPPSFDPAPLIDALKRQTVALDAYTARLAEVPRARARRAKVEPTDAGAGDGATGSGDAAAGDAGAEGGA